MKIINVHQREYKQKSVALSEIIETLASKDDRIWPKEIWPPMILSDGLNINSHGGHGPIGYYITNHDYGKSIEFTFTKPKEFIGTHKFDVLKISQNTTQLRHTIQMRINLKGIITWYFAIKWLHDALIEDCLDKVHNQLNENKARTPHNFWVQTLRKILKRIKT